MYSIRGNRRRSWYAIERKAPPAVSLALTNAIKPDTWSPTCTSSRAATHRHGLATAGGVLLAATTGAGAAAAAHGVTEDPNGGEGLSNAHITQAEGDVAPTACEDGLGVDWVIAFLNARLLLVARELPARARARGNMFLEPLDGVATVLLVELLRSHR